MIRVTNRSERREAVTAINVYDQENDIPSSQRAKYESPIWYYLTCMLQGKDGEHLSVDDLVKQLHKSRIMYSKIAISKTLQNMMNAEESIKPCRRNIGLSCYHTLEILGGLKSKQDPEWNNIGRAKNLYYFNTTTAKVNAFKKKEKVKL
jgi:hypothetical protein